MDFMRLSDVLARIAEIQQRFQFDFGVSGEPFQNVLKDAVAKGSVPPPGTADALNALNPGANAAVNLTAQNNALAPLEAQEKTLKSMFPAESAASVTAAKGVDLESLIAGVAQSQGVEPSLLKAIVSAESNFNTKAVSSKGAMGLMQLMPETANSLGVANPFDAEENLTGGAKYFNQLISQFGSLPLALAAYNAGPSAVQQHGGIPPFQETQDYVQKVLELKKQFEQK